MTVTIHTGDCRTVLPTLPARSVRTCVTSPPYFGLRDYGHDTQIGLEPTVEAYVESLVAVFREVRRVLADDGTLWLNLGDSYAGSGPSGASYQSKTTREREGKNTDGAFRISKSLGQRGLTYAEKKPVPPAGLKHKDLIGIPWRVAFALQADGWYLRSDVIWHKPNPMPESVTDRPTKAHEYLFLMSKAPRYYYDAAAIAEPATTQDGGDRPQRARGEQIARNAGLTQEHLDAIRAAGITDTGKAMITQTGTGKNTERVQQLAREAKEALGGYYREFVSAGTRNKRSVWTVGTQPYKGAHFATFPPDLIEPCIKAGSAAGDAVLDPFGGSGTTGMVADRLGRDAVLIDANPAYVELARRRITSDAPMFASVQVLS